MSCAQFRFYADGLNDFLPRGTAAAPRAEHDRAVAVVGRVPEHSPHALAHGAADGLFAHPMLARDPAHLHGS